MKKYLLILVSMIVSESLMSQELPTNLDLFTKRQIEQGKFSQTDINLFVKGDLNKIKVAVEKVGGYYKYGYKNIAAVNIPIKKLDAFVQCEGIEGFENADIPVVPLTDQSIILNNVIEVHVGQSPLTQPYKGDGVIMGVIDDGIDFRHADFMNIDSTTRIRYIWDQRAGNVNSPFPYGYGREWNANEINAGLCTHVEPSSKFGHGTSVAGMACGNGNATGNFVGMAPNTEIIFVAINEQRNFLSTIADAVDFIFKKADAIGKPCVINISYGTYFGSRDAIDLGSQMMENLLSQRNGRVIVAAAGNAGHIKYHLGYNVTSDTSFTWFKKIPNDVDLYFSVWADTADFTNVNFAFAADDTSRQGNTLIAQTPFYSIKGSYPVNPGFVDVVQKIIELRDTANQIIGTIRTQVTHTEGRYLFEAIILPIDQTNLWRFITTGSGRLDCWSSTLLIGNSDMVTDFPNDSAFLAKVPSIQNYKFPDNKKTMVSSFQNSEKVITVANYNNLAWYPNACGDTTYTGLITGALNEESSRGPTRDNRQKPDISATGTFTLATGNLTNIAALLGSNNCNKVSADSLHQRNGGTSSASPHVAGAVALYLQKNPDAWWYEAKAAVVTTAKRDTFTGNNLPDNEWGHGKLCAFCAMQTNLTYGCTDTAAFNYDANAQFDDGSCIAKRYGCMDGNALNYDSLANVSDTCFYYQNPSSVINTTAGNFIFAYPNPAQKIINFNYEISLQADCFIEIYDIIGSSVERIELKNLKGVVRTNTSDYNKGIYFYHLISDNKILSVNRFAVY